MLFKVDENLPAELREFLTSAGHDALTVADQQLQGHPDSAVHDVCRGEGRSLVTLDRGFGDVRRYVPSPDAGLIVLRLARQDKQHVLTHFQCLIPLLSRERLAGHLWVVEEGQIRIRPANLSPVGKD